MCISFRALQNSFYLHICFISLRLNKRAANSTGEISILVLSSSAMWCSYVSLNILNYLVTYQATFFQTTPPCFALSIAVEELLSQIHCLLKKEIMDNRRDFFFFFNLKKFLGPSFLFLTTAPIYAF